jgi:hypothetical protein
MDEDERAKRLGKNEAIFREVNERIESVNLAFASVTETMTVVCECCDLGCTGQFTMSIADYEALRRDSTLFAVKPGHEATEVEDVVTKNDEFWVVQKRPGSPEQIAQALDERSS